MRELTDETRQSQGRRVSLSCPPGTEKYKPVKLYCVVAKGRGGSQKTHHVYDMLGSVETSVATKKV